MKDSQSDPSDDTGSDSIIPSAGTSDGDQRRIDDEFGVAAGQATGGLAGDASDDLSDDAEAGGP